MIYNLAFIANGYDDLRVPLTSVKIPTENAPGFSQVKSNGAGSTGVFAYAFDNATEESVYFAVQMPHAWDEGTTIYPHVHWSPAVNGTAGQKVAWGLEYSFGAVSGAMGTTTLIYGDTPIGYTAGGIPTAGTHYKTNIGSGIDMSSITTVSAMLLCRLFRDAGATGAGMTDDLAQDAHCFEFDFHYLRRDNGSVSVSG